MRCTCGKICFRDELAAKYALAKAAKSDRPNRNERRAYRCEHGRWHLTSQPKGHVA